MHVYKTDEITRNKIFQDCRQHELTPEKANTTLCIIRSNEFTLGRFTLECRIEMYCTLDFRMQLWQIHNNILIRSLTQFHCIHTSNSLARDHIITNLYNYSNSYILTLSTSRPHDSCMTYLCHNFLQWSYCLYIHTPPHCSLHRGTQ